MRTIYIDSEFKCHVANNGTMNTIETDFFDGKCDAFIEGYCYNTKNNSIYPWKPYSELKNAQEKYEQEVRIATLEKDNAALKEETAMLMQCILEMSEMVYA